MAEERYLTAREAQAYLRLGKNTLLKLRVRGLPFIKVGKKVLFRQRDLDAFMEKLIVKGKGRPWRARG